MTTDLRGPLAAIGIVAAVGVGIFVVESLAQPATLTTTGYRTYEFITRPDPNDQERTARVLWILSPGDRITVEESASAPAGTCEVTCWGNTNLTVFVVGTFEEVKEMVR